MSNIGHRYSATWFNRRIWVDKCTSIALEASPIEEARPLMTSADILDELALKIDPTSVRFDEQIGRDDRTRQCPNAFAIAPRSISDNFPLRLEAFLAIDNSFESRIPGAESRHSAGLRAIANAGRERFYEHERDERHVSYRRVHPEPSTTKNRHVAEIVAVRYDSWERALQGMLRGEIVGIPRIGLKDLKTLQEDNRFFVVPYALPISHFILFHPKSVALRDGQLRRALSLAISPR